MIRGDSRKPQDETFYGKIAFRCYSWDIYEGLK